MIWDPETGCYVERALPGHDPLEYRAQVVPLLFGRARIETTDGRYSVFDSW